MKTYERNEISNLFKKSLDDTIVTSKDFEACINDMTDTVGLIVEQTIDLIQKASDEEVCQQNLIAALHNFLKTVTDSFNKNNESCEVKEHFFSDQSEAIN